MVLNWNFIFAEGSAKILKLSQLESIPVGCVPPTLPTVCALVAIRCQHWDPVLKWTSLNRSQVLATLGHWGQSWEGPSTVKSNASWVLVTWDQSPPHTHRMTDTTETITFQQLRWRTLKTIDLFICYLCCLDEDNGLQTSQSITILTDLLCNPSNVLNILTFSF